MRSRYGLALSAALGALLLARTLAAAETFVVVEARGVNLSPGAAVDGGQPLSLGEGQEVVLISASGRMLKLIGPYNQPPGAEGSDSGTDVVGALKSLVVQQGPRSGAVGLVRGNETEVVPPEPWLVDVTHAGNRCVREGEPIVFWRPTDTGSATLSIMPYDRSWRIRADWPAGEHEAVAPKSVPFHDDATYMIALNGAERTINLITIPATVSTDAMRAGWMVEKGCQAQAQALARALK